VKASLGLPTHRLDRGDEFVGGDAIAQMAGAAEAAGFDAVFVTEHPFPGDVWLAHGGHHALDPLVALSFAAAATTRLRLQTNLYIAAYRNPFLSAKAIATLDVLSGGRVILGVGAGYLEPEFAALGVEFEERNALTDEALQAMKAAWTGESVAHDGLHFRAPGNTMLPRPAQRPHPPLWIGGNSRRAIRRAVEQADGWVPMPNPARSAARRRTPALESLDDLRAGIAYAREHGEAVGREAPLDIQFMPLGIDMFSVGRLDDHGAADGVVEGVAELAEAGVTWLAAGVPGETRTEFLDNVVRYGEEVLARVRSIEGATWR
jgi:probable F420-dependent oxidoreductase